MSTIQDYKDAAREYNTVNRVNKAIGIEDSFDAGQQMEIEISLLTYLSNYYDVDVTLLEHYIAGFIDENALKIALANQANSEDDYQPDLFEECPNYCGII